MFDEFQDKEIVEYLFHNEVNVPSIENWSFYVWISDIWIDSLGESELSLYRKYVMQSMVFTK